MGIMEEIFERAGKTPQRVAFPECEEEKILKAARECADKGLCIPYLVGDPAGTKAAAERFGVCLEGLMLVDAFDEAFLGELVPAYVAQYPLLSEKSMRRKGKDPMYVALMMQALDRVDVTFAGLSHSTGDVILAGQTVVGLKEGVSTISSMGIFDIPGYEGPEGNLLGFCDSAVCVNPTPEELASIAVSSCDTVRALVGWEPRCALLSYSTDGSADSDLVDKVRQAVKIAQEKRPDLAVDGEFQLDAAISPAVAQKKVKRPSAVAGRANIIVWPDLNVGNIGVKLVQQFAHADAYGPMLQGFAKIVCDCSRGAPVSELVGNIAMSCVRAQEGA